MNHFVMMAQVCHGRAHKWTQRAFLQQHTLGRKGVCGELAAKWIRDTACGIPFNNTTNTLNGREEIMGLALSRFRGQSNIDYYLGMYGINKIHVNTYQYINKQGMFLFMAANVCYYIITISTPGPLQAHAIALDMYHLKIFDPNFGQVKFEHFDNLKVFIRLLLMNKYPTYNNQILIECYSLQQLITPDEVDVLTQELQM
ncbi:YopT-type cysteine protease domain-containing protein [Bilophila wadsworthia]|uniref:YopT-type cysteine protease domain-containing protein n=1 Tax=Bilophila wadsworthia TaxID=35833 RepID=UPI00307C52A1